MILYQGPSLIDGKPIVAIITGLSSKSKNSKTGQMPQVWIIRADIHPTEALRAGEDYSICGNCPHRPKTLGADALKQSSRTCYVNTMSFNAVYKKFANGGYTVADLSQVADILRGSKVRLGAYGDPAAVPVEVWDAICAYCESTGYTHQWRTCNNRYAEYCMASCDNIVDVVDATNMGYRTFFVQSTTEPSQVIHQIHNIKLAHCPASKEKGKVTTCYNCMACSGTRLQRKSNITIMLH